MLEKVPLLATWIAAVSIAGGESPAGYEGDEQVPAPEREVEMLKLRALIVAGLLLGATSLVAQEGPVNKHERKGFWVGFGLGYGWLHIEGGSGSEGGFSGNFSIGGTISQNVLLGFQSNGWYKSESGFGIPPLSTTTRPRRAGSS